jgi:hypothetical protein
MSTHQHDVSVCIELFATSVPLLLAACAEASGALLCGPDAALTYLYALIHICGAATVWHLTTHSPFAHLQGAAQPMGSALTDSEFAAYGDSSAADAAGYAADGIDSSVTAAANRAIATGLVSQRPAGVQDVCLHCG